jgi:hypothetical protein
LGTFTFGKYFLNNCISGTLKIIFLKNPVYLKMPEQESEYESDSDSHEPGDEEEGHAVWVGLVVLQHQKPLGNLPVLLRKHRRVRNTTLTNHLTTQSIH